MAKPPGWRESSWPNISPEAFAPVTACFVDRSADLAVSAIIVVGLSGDQNHRPIGFGQTIGAKTDRALEIAAKLQALGLRVDADLSDGRMGAKIRHHQQMKVPYMLILGEKEQESGAVSVRPRSGEQENGVAFDDFVSMINEKIETRAEL